jgi:hypothetical protein
MINIMRIPLKAALKLKVQPVWFLAACVLLGAVTITATVMAWKIVSIENHALQQLTAKPQIVSGTVLK